MKRLVVYCIFLSIFSGYAQEEISYFGYGVQTFGSVSTDSQTPFWMVGNQYGVVPLEANNGHLRTSMGYHHFLNRAWSLDVKADLVAATPRYRPIYAQQMYVELAFKGIRLSMGSHETGQYLQTVTDPFISSGDLGLATNARPIPELNLYSPDFIRVPLTRGWLQTKGNFAVGRSFDTDYLESFIGDNQYYIQNTLWHHKSLYLRLKDTQNGFPVSFTIGIRHAVQWGGEATNPVLIGQQPQTFKDFLRVVLGKSGGGTASLSDQINALGAHHGTYDFRLGFEKKDWAIYGYYQHIFGDASGMEFYNAFDGLAGIQIEISKFPWISKIVFEHLDTRNQSGPFHFIQFDHDKYPGYGGGGDNYYNNGEYTTGFSYFNRSLGTPLMISPAYNAKGQLGFLHSRVQAGYIGAEGSISRNLSWRLRMSTLESLGTPYAPTHRKLTANSFATYLSYARNDWTFTTSIAADKGSLLGTHWGFGLSIAKQGMILNVR